MLREFLQPAAFNRAVDKIIPVSAMLCGLSLIVGLYLSFGVSPPDYQQGEAVRIMYVHVPAAWMSLFVYGVIAMMSAGSLVWKNPLCDHIARGSAPIGIVFTMITLITGAIWGKPMWGAWWVWDARLTSVLILFFLYIAYLALLHGFEDEERGARSAAILALVGSVNLPIIKFSVEWWNTLHQPASILRADGPAIHSSMLAPLFVMFAGFLCYYVTLMLLGVKTSLIRRRLERKFALHRSIG